MILDQRVFHQLNDISVITNDFRNGSYLFPFQVGQFLYIGSIFPFNNLFFDLASVNSVDAVVKPEIWWGGGDGWTDAVDVIDETDGLKKTGRIQWNTDIHKGWNHEYECRVVTGLETKKVYNMYWMRFSWDVNLTPTTAFNYIGQKFSDDIMLQSFYPDLLLPRVLDAFKSGKTNWNEQHYMAAVEIIRDLKKRDIIKGRAQLLDYSLFTDAACHKVAELAYRAFGQPYFEHVRQAHQSYSDATNLKFYNTDLNADARLDPVERTFKTDFMRR